MNLAVRNQQKENSFASSNVAYQLSHSFQRAKEKVLKNVENCPNERSCSITDRSILQGQNHSFSRLKMEDRGAVAGAMKTLQNKVNQLETMNAEYRNIIAKAKSQSAKRQVEIQQLNKEKTRFNGQSYQLSTQIHEKKLEIIRLSCELKALTEQNYSLEAELRLKSSMLQGNKGDKAFHQRVLKDRLLQLENRQKTLLSSQKQKNELIKQYQETIINSLASQKRLENEIQQIKCQNESQSVQILLLTKQLSQQKTRNDVFIRNQLKESEAEDSIRNSRKHQNSYLNVSRKGIKEDQRTTLNHRKLVDKNQQLYSLLKLEKKKVRASEKQTKDWKDKFTTLKSLSADIIEMIRKLPQNMQSLFKYLITKVNKIDGYHLECLRSHSNSRQSVRILRNSCRGSGEKSGKKKRKMRMEDLQSSMQKNLSKSKKHKQSKNSFTQKESRRQLLNKSQTFLQALAQLQKKVQEAKKNYKQISKEGTLCESGSSVRDRLNKITEQIEQYESEKQKMKENNSQQ